MYNLMEWMSGTKLFSLSPSPSFSLNNENRKIFFPFKRACELCWVLLGCGIFSNRDCKSLSCKILKCFVSGHVKTNFFWNLLCLKICNKLNLKIKWSEILVELFCLENCYFCNLKFYLLFWYFLSLSLLHKSYRLRH